MQIIEKIILLFRWLLRYDAFGKKYKVKKMSMLPKILNNNNFLILDIRNSIDYDEHHIKNSINIPNYDFYKKYYKELKNKSKILIVNSNYRSNLNIYNFLKNKKYNPYILRANYDEVRKSEKLDKFCIIKVIN